MTDELLENVYHLTLLRIAWPQILTSLSFVMNLSLVFKITINSTGLGIWLNICINSRHVRFVTMENTKDCLCKNVKLES